MADEMEELFGSEDDDDEEDETSRIQSSQTKTTSTNDSNKSSSEMNELFGSDNEENEENDEEANMEKAEVPNLTSRLSRERTEMTEIFGSDVDEDDDAGTFDSTQDTVRGTEHATICISETTRLSGDPKMVLKLPHFIKIQTTPFSKDTYDADAERQAFAGATAVIRWRYKQNASGEIEYDDSGKPIRESNSRMVKYSDGSFAILIGDEVFECNVIPVRDTYVFYLASTLMISNSPFSRIVTCFVTVRVPRLSRDLPRSSRRSLRTHRVKPTCNTRPAWNASDRFTPRCIYNRRL